MFGGRKLAGSKMVAVVVAVGAVLCLAAQTAVNANAPKQGRIDNPLIVRGCAVRLEDSGPYLLGNSAHYCTGFRSVSYSHGWLEIISDSSRPVVSIAVSPDESLVARGILAGASGGGLHTRIRFYSIRTHHVLPAESPLLHCPKCNVWITITSFDTQ